MTDPETMTAAVVELARRQTAHFYGKYRGIVVDNRDPEGQGRLRVKVPDLLGDQPTGWALACVPYAPPGKGLYCLPETGDPVWVEFEGGQPSKPIWTGGFWGQGQGPGAAPSVKRWETQGGHHITLDDSAGDERVEIVDAHGGTIRLSAQGIELTKGPMKVQITEAQISFNDGALTVMS
ncbi:MAG: phage baseplate assembly protein V [Pirellulales bacterium]